MDREHFISPDALEKRLGEDNLSIICNFMYMPGENLDGRDEYEEDRIQGAVYFDLDEISDQSSPLPHMIASPEQFARQMGEMGISESDDIVIYDGPGLFSSARIWWNLRIMGAKSVRILEGGYDQWIGEDRPIDEMPPKEITPKIFNAVFDSSRVVDIRYMEQAVKEKHSTILDARSLQRFAGEVEEPRKGLRLGHMPGARALPFSSMLENGTLFENSKLKDIINPLIEDGKPIITSCGSGVTAAVLSLALTCIGHDTHKLYDGSWTEWGDPDQSYPIATGEE